MNFPKINKETLLDRLEVKPGKLRMVLDTDAFNEIDDQFAIVYALKSTERLDVEAIYAAPFYNKRSTGPADGMEKSYDEILRVLDRLKIDPKGLVFKGVTNYLQDAENPEQCEAVMDLIDRAMKPSKDPLYVVAIGAITNIATAILIEPKIIEKIVVVWLGGHALNWSDTKEFNLKQDVPAAQVVFNCGVPLIHIPCMGVTSHLLTTIPEIEKYVEGKGEIGNYLSEIFKAYGNGQFAWSKVIWDVAAIAYLINPDWVPTNIVNSPIVTDQLTWSFDQSRHFIKSATYIKRDSIFKDLFNKI